MKFNFEKVIENSVNECLCHFRILSKSFFNRLNKSEVRKLIESVSYFMEFMRYSFLRNNSFVVDVTFENLIAVVEQIKTQGRLQEFRVFWEGKGFTNFGFRNKHYQKFKEVLAD